jgi:hypothetical protein
MWVLVGSAFVGALASTVGVAVGMGVLLGAFTA